MPLRPIDPEGDSRIEHKTAVLNGNSYHYLYGVPVSGKFKYTVFLVSSVLQPVVNAQRL
jgi:soluble epoxide hydrolase / lipid-phosphate phosphatase